MYADKSASMGTRLWVHLTLAVLLCIGFGAARPLYAQDANLEALQQIGRTLAGIAEQAFPGVVVIEVERVVSSDAAPRGMQEAGRSPSRARRSTRSSESRMLVRPVPEALRSRAQRQHSAPLSKGRGMGIIVSEDGLIITNHHIVEDANRIEVRLSDGRSIRAEVVGLDPKTDIAVLRIEANGLQALELGDSKSVALGDWVVGIGDGMGLGRTFSVGMVTGKHRAGLGRATYEDFLQTSAAPSLGDAGGPLLDLQGRVIGVNTAVLGQHPGPGIGLAIPIDMAKAIYEQLRGEGKVRRGFLGIGMEDVSAGMAESLGMARPRGIIVTSVFEGSAAAQAGLRKHDVIVQFSGKDVVSAHALRFDVGRLKPGAAVEIVLIREAQQLSLNATLGQWPTKE